MIFGAILAGGIGSRMNIQDMPKQFLPLGDKPILVHTLEKFALCSDIDEIFIGAHPNWIQHTKDLVKKYIPDSCEHIHVVAGGKDRNETIIHIIEAVEKEYGENDENIIITHDSVRPFVTLRILKDNIEAAKKHGACDTVISATDTIVVSENGKTITNIPERRLMSVSYTHLLNLPAILYFITFFPTLSSGPIDRYKHFTEDLQARIPPRQYAENHLLFGLKKIALGIVCLLYTSRCV